jgi:hypothetical protein
MVRQSVVEGKRRTESRIEMEILFNPELMQLAQDPSSLLAREVGQCHGRNFSVTPIYPFLEAV